MLAHFNPRSPHGERPPQHDTAAPVCRISIHAPRTGSDRKGQENDRHTTDFNPRSPHGERPPRTESRAALSAFQSTLPARGATNAGKVAVLEEDFNPRSPHGERRESQRAACFIICISIHAPRTGSDHVFGYAGRRAADFNPRSPHGERRPHLQKGRQRYEDFNPRSPHGERRYFSVRV